MLILRFLAVRVTRGFRGRFRDMFILGATGNNKSPHQIEFGGTYWILSIWNTHPVVARRRLKA
jgi:hypothetical protein